MTAEQLITVVVNIPGIIVLVWVIIRQDKRIDALLEAQSELIERFIPPPEPPAPITPK